MSARRHTSRGLTLVELLLALAVTAFMGIATASMLSMAGSSSQRDREGRSFLLRAHAARTRLRAYFEPALCILQNDTSRNAVSIWLQDSKGAQSVNLTEIRVFWFDPSAKTLTVEYVEFPAAWPQAAKDVADALVPSGSDYIASVLAQRALGYTVRRPVIDRLWSASWGFDVSGATPVTSAARIRLAGMMGVDNTSATSLLFTFGLPNRRTPAK